MKWGFNAKDLVYMTLIGIGLFFGWRLYTDLTQQISDQKVAYKQLSENVARASNQFVTKHDLDEFGKEISGSFNIMKADIKKLGGQVTTVGQTIAKLEAHVERDAASDHTAEVELPDGTTTRQDFKKIKNEEGLPMAWSMYTIGKEHPWTVGTYELEFHINTVLGVTEDDQIIPENELVVFNNQDAETKGKPFKLPIVSSMFKQTMPNQSQFFLWAPHLDFGLNVGAALTGEGILGPDLGFSVMAYGKTKNDNEWRFARLGIGTRDGFHKPQVTLSPVGYNLGKFIPLLSDLWLWPTASFGIGDFGSYGLGATISTTF